MIKIYVGDVSELKDEKLFYGYYSLMPQSRKEKIDRYAFDKDKRLSLGVGILLQNALNETKFEYYNLSHSGERALCAVSDRRVGCDVEEIRRCDIGIAKRFFRKEEYDALAVYPEGEERDKLFFRYWTCKESYIKALREGLKHPLDSFTVDFSGDEGKVRDTDFNIVCPDIEDNYAYAICGEGSIEIERQIYHYGN